VPTSFDEISHPALMDRVRARIADKRVLALVKAFLKAGILTERGTAQDTITGTPQGSLCAAAHKPPYEQCWLMRSARCLPLVGAVVAVGRCA
jgi:RNA-directed DNA polymerase